MTSEPPEQGCCDSPTLFCTSKTFNLLKNKNNTEKTPTKKLRIERFKRIKSFLDENVSS